MKAYITLIYKSGNCTHPRTTTHPISLTSIISKVMEHIIIITSNLMHHLESNLILTEVQNGFHCNRSCKSQLVSLLYDLTFMTKVFNLTFISTYFPFCD